MEPLGFESQSLENEIFQISLFLTDYGNQDVFLMIYEKFKFYFARAKIIWIFSYYKHF